MLIEAARGGHTSVVNLLLRQPLMKRRQQIDQASLANDNRKLTMSARKHATAPATNATSTTTAAGQLGKPLTSTLQHISPEQTLPRSQSPSTNLDSTATGTGTTSLQQPSLSGTTGSSSSGAGTSLVHLQHHTKIKGAQKPTKHQSQSQQQPGQMAGREREGGAQQLQQVASDGPEKVVMLPMSSASCQVTQGSGESSSSGDLIGAKRPKMSGSDRSPPAGNESAQMATPTKQPLVDSDLSYLVTPPRPPAHDVPSAFSPGHYTTDSATALKNMQRLTSNANSPLKCGTGVSSDVGTSVDVPPLVHSQTHLVNSTHANSSDVALPSTQLTPDDIIQGHMTADDIIARYWRQQQNATEVAEQCHPTSTTCSVSESKANGTAKESASESNAQRMFSSGNFSTLPPPGQGAAGGGAYHPPRFHASSSAMGMPPADPQSFLVNSVSGGNHGSGSSGINQAPSVDSHPLSNMDLTRLIPHLEALAGSLQNPSSFESHYLAALAAQSHLMHPSVPSEENSIELPPDIGDEKVSLPPAMGSLDPSALLSAAEIAKLLPNIASSFESQSDTGDFPAVSSSSTDALHSEPIYPTSLSTLRHLSQKLQGHSPGSEMGPNPGGGGGGGGEGTDEDGSELDVDLLQQNAVRSLPPSLLLDSKFPLDIPPPNDLIPSGSVSIMQCLFAYMCSMVPIHLHSNDTRKVLPSVSRCYMFIYM